MKNSIRALLLMIVMVLTHTLQNNAMEGHLKPDRPFTPSPMTIMKNSEVDFVGERSASAALEKTLTLRGLKALEEAEKANETVNQACQDLYTIKEKIKNDLLYKQELGAFTRSALIKGVKITTIAAAFATSSFIEWLRPTEIATNYLINWLKSEQSAQFVGSLFDTFRKSLGVDPKRLKKPVLESPSQSKFSAKKFTTAEWAVVILTELIDPASKINPDLKRLYKEQSKALVKALEDKKNAHEIVDQILAEMQREIKNVKSYDEALNKIQNAYEEKRASQAEKERLESAIAARDGSWY